MYELLIGVIGSNVNYIARQLRLRRTMQQTLLENLYTNRTHIPSIYIQRAAGKVNANRAGHLPHTQVLLNTPK